ncbi:transporter substrate-binding domain-containing protein [Vibrio vulnificus]|uniref:transporter substrate-binding domain-containing protein n=1 Tax=Vibrio vulnificus TaxID=672 RepID=UPI000CD082D0|nr:transporter substrate-binding domain-containing protein [Vibrio vulnificus]AVX01490.1 amino acid ABC transporter substrate-binding protein [Vibrio vulnificus Env1]EGQ7940690.1 transporter substrate-binding domain-containing protein [Vibrio vulnificus]EGQ8078160.1 transporter substrate-binding domain-containing protein [Vibrio vulnificus]EHH0710666.1 transporter substrate-binding domain-containing protein [Vibrio vulnificus]EHH1187206.1 transporter substrate-binding domain-containing protein
MNKLLFVVTTLLLSCLSHAATITAAQDPWAPFVQQNNANPGISVEIVIEAFKTQGHDVDFKIMPWTRALNEVKDGRVDVLVATWFTQERTSYLNYSQPYLENSLKFIKRSGDGFEYNGMDSLSGKNVGIIRNYGYGDEFLKATNFNKPEANDLVANAKKLLAKRIDLTLEDELVAKATLSGAGMNLSDFDFTNNALSVNPLHVTSGLANAKNGEIIEAFNKGLAEIKANGTFDKILMKYGIQ